jgi:hypothetical protein
MFLMCSEYLGVGTKKMVHERHEPHERVRFADEVYRIQGAIYEVNPNMGAGILEAVNQECLALEFTARDIPFVADAPLALAYEGRPLRQRFLRGRTTCRQRAKKAPQRTPRGL